MPEPGGYLEKRSTDSDVNTGDAIGSRESYPRRLRLRARHRKGRVVTLDWLSMAGKDFVFLMKVRIVYVGRVRTAAGCKEEAMEVERGSAVLQILEKLTAKHGDEFRKAVFDNGELALGLNVLIDGVNVTNQVSNKEGGATATLPEKEAGETELELVLLELPPSGG